MGVAALIREFQRLGLRASPQKTQIISFVDAWNEPVRDSVEAAGIRVPVGNRLKYLGLVIDPGWTFDTHFRELLPRVEKMAMAIVRLMPNLRGPGERRRRLYAGVIHSAILYRAPVWAPAVAANKRLCGDLGRLQRRVALRVIAAYRTVSLEAAGLLAGIVPFDILAGRYWRLYRRMREVSQAISGRMSIAQQESLSSNNGIPGNSRTDVDRSTRESIIQQWYLSQNVDRITLSGEAPPENKKGKLEIIKDDQKDKSIKSITKTVW
ncbi:PREDICTED: uncharacterized protein LOC105450178 [Wasmannia auropunctata]|uniref:uncharacterized protein LOC105450178 n=1 Tax=Wasmannia auropunctata TaxID=64793 RepID=UPI0005EF9212|nr:PREDICTED: uncharacterized protein LOC105450178 [Wasmannia auropunctata]